MNTFGVRSNEVNDFKLCFNFNMHVSMDIFIIKRNKESIMDNF